MHHFSCILAHTSETFKHSAWDDLRRFKLNIRTGKRDGLNDFECGIIVGARRACLIKTADLLEFFCTAHLCGFAEDGLKKKKYPLSSSSLGEKALLLPGVQENNSNSHSWQSKCAVEHLWMHHMSNLDVKPWGYSSRNWGHMLTKTGQ